MAPNNGIEFNAPDLERVSSTMSDIAETSRNLVSNFLQDQSKVGLPGNPDPLNIGGAFLEMTQRMMTNPAGMMQAQMDLWQGYIELWHHTVRRWLGDENVDPVVTPEPGDRRFRDALWTDIEVFDFVKQSYLLTSRWMLEVVTTVDGLSDKNRHKVEFYTRQFADMMAPSNFVMTNPEVLRATFESGGENLLRGLKNLLADMEKGRGISMTDRTAFEVGRNVASSPGKVVFRNELMELVQYSPSTKKVAPTPLLIVPPWINKFYILDLRPENSFIKWAVDQGHTVFIISWVNPDEKLAHMNFADYMLKGPLAAVGAIEEATGVTGVNAIGYCIGGTLLASTLAYMAEKKDDRIKSATFFTTLTDFAEAGDLQVFIDDVQLDNMDDMMSETGYLDGSEMATTFNMLRANDLIWSFVVNNYLLGKDPFPFDLLYWNGDSTRMPVAMHSFYLRKMYLENQLAKPGGIELDGVDIDLTKVKVPAYFASTRDDHIAPWKGTFATTRMFQGPKRFVLSASGHIAGIINPPAAKKYCYWINETLEDDPDAWLSKATKHDHSWWGDWQDWVKEFAGKRTVDARVPGEGGKLKALADAPGPYVKGEM
ncbi:MAG: PHA/PHB synthase family protein [Magnetospiraceae bacterium]